MAGSIALLVRLTCFGYQDGDLWVAGCPTLDVYSQGDSLADARHSLEDAVGLWFESCIERGTLEQAMKELGFRPISSQRTAEAAEDVVAVVETADEVAGEKFDVEYEIPAYQASFFMDQAVYGLSA